MSKNILITGSTDGIGKLAALSLAQAGHHLYVHGRNPQKLEQTITELQEAAPSSKIKGFVADFSNLSEVRQMAQTVKETIPQLDVLVNNAGVFKTPMPTNAAGLDLRFAVNYLAPYVLTQALLPLLQRQPGARLINLSSAAQAPVEPTVLLGQATRPDGATYAQSKLALTMWSFYLAKKHPDLLVLAVNPGSLLQTNMVKEAYGRYWSSADKGAQILHDLALNAVYHSHSGEYFDNDRGGFGPAHDDAYDEAKIEALMALTEQLVAAP